MKALTAVKEGIGLTNRKFGIVILLLLFNFIIALVLGIPMYYILQDSFGGSMVQDTMFEGFDTVWYSWFSTGAEGLAVSFKASIAGIGGILDNFVLMESGKLFDINSIPAAVFVLGILYLLAVTFLTGGVLGIYNEPEKKFSFGRFFGNSGKYFIRFFIFTAAGVACYLVIIKYFSPWFSGLFESMREAATEEKIDFFIDRIQNISFLILILFIGMLFDYARIATVVDKRRNVVFAVLRSLYVIIRHIHRTVTIYFLLAAAGAVLIVAYAITESLIPQNTIQNIIVIFGVYQLYMFLKLYIRCTFFTSQMAFYKGISRPREKEVKEEKPAIMEKPSAEEEKPKDDTDKSENESGDEQSQEI